MRHFVHTEEIVISDDNDLYTDKPHKPIMMPSITNFKCAVEEHHLSC